MMRQATIQASIQALLLGGALSLAGCGGSTDGPPTGGAVRQATAPPAASEQLVPGQLVPPAPPGPPPAPADQLVQAQAGVGAQGRSLDQHEGLIVTPAKTLFAAREQVVFNIAIPQALNLYKAANGSAPKSHDEFMQKIVAENNIQLPALPAGHVYEFHPDTEQLMVRRPGK